MRELATHGVRTLRARQLPEALAEYERKVNPRCLVGAEEAKSLWQVLHEQVSPVLEYLDRIVLGKSPMKTLLEKSK